MILSNVNHALKMLIKENQNNIRLCSTNAEFRLLKRTNEELFIVNGVG